MNWKQALRETWDEFPPWVALLAIMILLFYGIAYLDGQPSSHDAPACSGGSR